MAIALRLRKWMFLRRRKDMFNFYPLRLKSEEGKFSDNFQLCKIFLGFYFVIFFLTLNISETRLQRTRLFTNTRL
jgi:hypothetical protein